MKKNHFAYLLLIISFFVPNWSAFGKKVKFACNMSGQVVNTTGMHIVGDFQTVAGFAGGDWNSGTTALFQEANDTNIYSVVVDIPAFTKYEYKFVNGDQFYEAEFVPEYSRVGYNFNDNRWLYVDSLADDTTFVGALIFAGNAPAGLKLVRFYVDMTNQIVDASGVHIEGNFQNWNPENTIMYSFVPNLYEIIAYADSNYILSWRFINGSTNAGSETVPVLCQVNGNRDFTVTDDVLMGYICFGECGPCLNGITESNSEDPLLIYPNPSNGSITIKMGIQEKNTIYISDTAGRRIRIIEKAKGEMQVNKDVALQPGTYFISYHSLNGPSFVRKLIIN